MSNVFDSIIDDNKIEDSFAALMIKDENHAVSLAADILSGLMEFSTEKRGGDVHKEMILLSGSGRTITVSGKKK